MLSIQRASSLLRCSIQPSRAALRLYSCTPPRWTPLKPKELHIEGTTYATDGWTNVTPTILSKLPRQLHQQPSHPVAILRKLVEQHFPDFEHVNTLSPVVTVKQNFDDLGFPADHPGRSKTDSYYINERVMLRTHTSAHEVELYQAGVNKFLLSADVYRRDEIDSSHYPVFHQMEGANLIERTAANLDQLKRENKQMEAQLAQANILITDPTKQLTETNPRQEAHTDEEAIVVAQHLKNTLNGLVLRVFGALRKEGDAEPLQVRWIEATFPWTGPSFEVEVLYEGKWLEILGCGVVQQHTLDRSGAQGKIGWAFGLGLERIAMVLFSIPDIRLFWSTDARFSSQFAQDAITAFKPYSKYPECYKDFSFWLPDKTAAGDDWHENDFCEVVRDVAGDLVENVTLIDSFTHPKTGRKSVCYRLNYRSMDRSLENDEVNVLQQEVIDTVVQKMRVEPR